MAVLFTLMSVSSSVDDRVSGAFKWRSRWTRKVFYSGWDSDASFTSLKKVVLALAVFEEGFS